MNYDAAHVRKLLGYFLLASIALYIALSALLIARPNTVLVSKKITQYYQWFALPGPFFREDRIRYVPHFYIAYKKSNEPWSEWRNIERENFVKYSGNLFRYGKLNQSRYERHIVRTLGNKVSSKPRADILQFREFKELHAYLKARYLPPETDSVKLLYKLDDLNDTSHKLSNTVFQIDYKSF